MTMLAQDVAGSNPTTWLDVLRHDVIPAASAFAVWVALLVVYRRSVRNGKPVRPSPTHRRALGALASMVVGGYVVFVAIVVLFYFVLGGEAPSFILQALGEGSVLTFGMVVPAFLGLSWLAERGRPRPSRERP